MTLAEVKVNKDGKTVQVKGVLNFATVSELRSAGDSLLKEIAEPVIDFKEVVRSDSAALTLFTAWSRSAQKEGKSVRFINIPSQLMDIARLSSLDKILFLLPLSS